MSTKKVAGLLRRNKCLLCVAIIIVSATCVSGWDKSLGFVPTISFEIDTFMVVSFGDKESQMRMVGGFPLIYKAYDSSSLAIYERDRDILKIFAQNGRMIRKIEVGLKNLGVEDFDFWRESVYFCTDKGLTIINMRSGKRSSVSIQSEKFGTQSDSRYFYNNQLVVNAGSKEAKPLIYDISKHRYILDSLPTPFAAVLDNCSTCGCQTTQEIMKHHISSREFHFKGQSKRFVVLSSELYFNLTYHPVYFVYDKRDCLLKRMKGFDYVVRPTITPFGSFTFLNESTAIFAVPTLVGEELSPEWIFLKQTFTEHAY